MTGSQQRALVILSVALSVVTALLFLPEAAREDDRGVRDLFPGALPDDLTALELARPDGVVVGLERLDGRWMLTHPVQDRADAVRAGALARALVTARVREAVPEADPERYGLSAEAAIDVRLSLRGREERLALGAATVDGGTYLLHRDRVFPAEGMLAEQVPPHPDAIRDRRLLENALDTEALSIRCAGAGSFHHGTEGWTDHAGHPLDSAPADAERLLRVVAGLRIAEFDVEEPFEPSLTLELDGPAGERSTILLEPGEAGLGPLARAPWQAGLVRLETGAVGELLELCSALDVLPALGSGG